MVRDVGAGRVLECGGVASVGVWRCGECWSVEVWHGVAWCVDCICWRHWAQGSIGKVRRQLDEGKVQAGSGSQDQGWAMEWVRRHTVLCSPLPHEEEKGLEGK
jgi:hypothetical protein